jgi:phosphorylcholine metabolism protein LicD
MNARQLPLLQEILALCETRAIPIWVRGGWAVDFALGQITREHEDIDLFAWAQDAERLVEAFEQAGFSPQDGPPPKCNGISPSMKKASK